MRNYKLNPAQPVRGCFFSYVSKHESAPAGNSARARALTWGVWLTLRIFILVRFTTDVVISFDFVFILLWELSGRVS